jgi:uncharacterized protein (TIGR02271 family)
MLSDQSESEENSVDILDSDAVAPEVTIPVVEERLAVHKTIADNGGVRLRKLVHSRLVDIDEDLLTDAVNVVHVPVGQDVEGHPAIRYEGGVTIIPVVEERLIVRRQLVLVEEIHVSRSTHVRRAPQSVTVRREEIVVERQAPGSDNWVVEKP